VRHKRTWQQRIQDIIASAEFILQLMRGRREEELASDRALRDAVLYNFVIIGEAEHFLPDGLKANHPEIDWTGMRTMRNWVAHVYHGVDLEIVARTIREDLPDLISMLGDMLRTESPESDG